MNIISDFIGAWQQYTKIVLHPKWHMVATYPCMLYSSARNLSNKTPAMYKASHASAALFHVAFGEGMLCWQDPMNFICSDLYVWIEHDKVMYQDTIYHSF